MVFWSAVLAALPGAGAAASDDCYASYASEAVAKCLNDELRASDAMINKTYRMLMDKLTGTARTRLRDEQRAWLKARDAACGLDSRESDRERWFRAILTDYRKTLCVTRFTRDRTAELSDMLAARTAGDAAARAAGERDTVTRRAQSEYRIVSPVARERGRWYFEVTIRPAAISRESPTALWMGCIESQDGTAVGALVQVRGSGPSVDTLRYGFALDIEEGRFYGSVTGVWRNGEPGSSRGVPAKAGRTYRCALDSTVPVAPMVDKGLIEVNFGERPFVYAVPAGYRPLVERAAQGMPPPIVGSVHAPDRDNDRTRAMASAGGG